MNQILITEKLYVTPEMKRKKLIYKIELFLSVFLICLLFSYYIYAEYDRNQTEQVSQEILADMNIKEVDTTIKKADNDVLVVILNKDEEREHESDEIINVVSSSSNSNVGANPAGIDTKTYTSKDGVKYTSEAILNVPCIGIKYPVLSTTSPALLFVSVNKYWGPAPNEIGNYCIVGHYYESGKMFGKLSKLKNGDTAELTDLSGTTIKYQVYDKYIVEPTDTKCTSQLTNGKRELTLITCTNHGKQRLVVKLREVSD